MNAGAVPVVYLGTSAFAATVLRRLAASPFSPALVVTPPDRPKGRGRRMASPPVAEAAGELGLELLQTARASEGEAAEAILGKGEGVAVVCAFGQIIREPLLGAIEILNVHPSLLPRWRGAAPLERTIMARDEETGVAIMRLTAGLDSGPVALVERVTVAPRETFGELEQRLSALGGELLVTALEAHARSDLEFAEQPEDGVTYAEKISADDRRLDPDRRAEELDAVVRALTPHIGAYVELDGGERLGISEAEPIAQSAASAGQFAVEEETGALILGCGEGALRLLTVQPPGKRPMAAADYLRGRPPPAR